jgi:hypothetical protein
MAIFTRILLFPEAFLLSSSKIMGKLAILKKYDERIVIPLLE